MLEVVKKDGLAFQYASPNRQRDRGILLQVMKTRPDIFVMVPKDPKIHRYFVLGAVKQKMTLHFN